MIVFEDMDEKLVERYHHIYNQDTLKSVSFNGGCTYILEFYTDNLNYALEVSTLRHPKLNFNLECLKNVDKTQWDAILQSANEKHTIDKEMFEDMLQDWFADHDPEEDVDGPLKVEGIKQNEDEEEEWELEAYAEDDHHAYVFTDFYGNIILNSLNTSF